MGFDWHRQCLKCEECNKVLNPGQHAEVRGILTVTLFFILLYTWGRWLEGNDIKTSRSRVDDVYVC